VAIRIFLDANILFSAAKSAGAIRELVSTLLRDGRELWADDYVVEEARRNLAAKAPEGLDYLTDLLKGVALAPIAAARTKRPLTKLPEKDRPVLEAAIHCACDFLVTGDKTHFGHLYGTRVEGVEIVAPATLATRLIQ
jgi:predicted nucleic acid-binding protein